MLSNWLGSWPYLPKAYLLTTWLNQKHPDVAQRFPSPELCELAYYAFQPLKPTGHGSLSKETPPSSDHFELLWHTSQSASDELRVAAWQVVAALVTLHGETALQDLLEFRYGWINQPEFEPWSPLAETLHLFWSQTTTSIPEIGFQLRRHNGQVSHAQALAKVKTEARDAFQMIKKPGINQRLRNHIVREKLDWLPDLLTRALADGQALAWASKFDPDTALVAWADEAGLKPIDPGEPEYRSLIRNLRNLQQAITDWGELALGPQDDPMARTINHLDQLQETITLERENWRSTWAKTRTKWPTLAGWSLLLLRRLEETFEGAGLDNGVGERHGRV